MRQKWRERGKLFHSLSLSLSFSLGACTYDIHNGLGRARGGGTPKAYKSTDKLRDCDIDKGAKKSADVIRTCPPLSLLCGVAQSVMKKVIKLALPLLQGGATIADRGSTTFFGANMIKTKYLNSEISVIN